MELFGLYNYWVFAALLMAGLYTVIASGNYIKKLIGLALFQSAVFLLYITLSKLDGGTAPILTDEGGPYSNPLPQVLILTAIVVGIATLALGLAVAVRIYETYGTIDEDEIERSDGR